MSWSISDSQVATKGLLIQRSVGSQAVASRGAITSKIKHAIKHKTGPARLAQLLQPSLVFCFSLQPMTVRRHWLQAKTKYALRFLHALEVDQGNLMHIPKINCKNLKLSLKFNVCDHNIISGLVGVSSRNFSRRRAARQRPCRGANVSTIFGMPDPSNLGGQRKRPNFGTISDNFRL